MRSERTSRAAGDALSEQSRATLAQEPASRVLDSKRPPGRRRSSRRPRRSTSSGPMTPPPTSRRSQAGLRALDIPFTLDMKLVRGLDYYRRTTFEFAGRHPRLGTERPRWRWSLRRPRRSARRPADPRNRVRARCRPHAARLRRRGCVRGARSQRRRVRHRHHRRRAGPADHASNSAQQASPPIAHTNSAA